MPKRKPATPKAEGSFHHGNLRAALVQRALEVVDEEGVSGVGVRRLARDLSVDPASVYRHFADLDALLGAVAQSCFEELSRATERAIERAADPEAAVRAAGEAYIANALAHPRRFGAMFGARGSGEDAWPRDPGVGPGGRTAWEALRVAVDALAAQTPLSTTPERAARVAWAAVHGLATLLTEGPLRRLDRSERKATLDATLSAVIAGIAPALR